MQTTTPHSNRGFWVVPGVGLAIGVAYLVAASVAGDVQLGLTMFAIMAAVTVGLVLASRRSETVRGLLDRHDERITSIDVEATAFAGGVLIVAVIGGMVVELRFRR